MPLQPFVDSLVEDNLLDLELARQLDCSTLPHGKQSRSLSPLLKLHWFLGTPGSNCITPPSSGAVKILGWSPHFHANCLCVCFVPPSPSSRFLRLTNVPPKYHDLCEVFCKDCVLSLPPHRPYDCTINLFPGAPLEGSCRHYSLSRPKSEEIHLRFPRC